MHANIQKAKREKMKFCLLYADVHIHHVAPIVREFAIRILVAYVRVRTVFLRTVLECNVKCRVSRLTSIIFNT